MESRMNKCVELLIKRKEIVEEVQRRFAELSYNADNSEIKKYSLPISGIGKFCPSLINFKIHSNRKSRRLLNDKPDLACYVQYDLDKDGLPLRISKYNQFGVDSNTYFYCQNDYVYAVPLFRNTIDDYQKNIYIYKVIGNQAAEYAEVGTASVYLEEYDHSDPNMIICYMTEYYNSEISNLSKEHYSDLISICSRKKGKDIFILSDNGERIDLWKYEIVPKEKISEYRFSNDKWVYNRYLRG